MNELVSSIHRADIKTTIFSIFWAAGPVTIIALSLGYYLSHGTRVPMTTLVYFSFYAFFVGLVGFMSKLVFDAIQYRKKEAMQERFLSVIDESYSNLYLSKRLNLANLTDDVKANKIAYDILSKSHPTSGEIFYAFDIHFGRDLAEFAQIIHLHKENSFPIDSQLNKHKLVKYYKKNDNKETIPLQLKHEFLKALRGDYITLNAGVELKIGLF